jgi:hypothetical protein
MVILHEKWNRAHDQGYLFRSDSSSNGDSTVLAFILPIHSLNEVLYDQRLIRIGIYLGFVVPLCHEVVVDHL